MLDPHFVDEVKFRIVFVNLFFRSEVLPEKKPLFNACLFGNKNNDLKVAVKR